MKLSGTHTKTFEKLIQIIGVDAALALSRFYGGKTLYIPKITNLIGRRRNIAIYSDYKTGEYTYRELSTKWGAPIGTIASIINTHRRLERTRAIILSD